MASRLEAIASRLEAVASRVEAIGSGLEAIASRLEAMASRLEAIASRLEAGWRPSQLGPGELFNLYPRSWSPFAPGVYIYIYIFCQSTKFARV